MQTVMQTYTMGLRILPPTTTINAFTYPHRLLRLLNDTPCIGSLVSNSTTRQFNFTTLCLQQPLRIKEKPIRKFSGSTRSPVMASVSQAPQSLAPDNMDEETKLWQQVQSHQKTAARLPAVEEIRTLLDSSLRGTLSTFSQNYEGYPSGSMVDICCDEDGCPILAISSLAVHTKDLLANPKCSLLVTKDPTDRTELVITLHGDAVFVPDNEREASRASYLRKHPGAFWVDFGDFQFVHIEPKCVRYVSGVATAMLGSGEFTWEEYKKAKVDPISQFSIPVASHMNRDHAEDTKLIVQHSLSIKVDHAQIIDLDRLGFNVKAGYQGKTLKFRIPFPRPAEDRRDVKNLIVEMLEAAKQVSID